MNEKSSQSPIDTKWLLVPFTDAFSRRLPPATLESTNVLIVGGRWRGGFGSVQINHRDGIRRVLLMNVRSQPREVRVPLRCLRAITDEVFAHLVFRLGDDPWPMAPLQGAVADARLLFEVIALQEGRAALIY